MTCDVTKPSGRGSFGWTSAPHCGVQQGFPFAGTRHDRGPATSVRGLWVKFLCKGPEVHLTSLFITFCHPFFPLLDNWALPQMATHDFGSHVGGITHLFILTPSNLHSVISYLLMNNGVLRILTGNLLSGHITV